VFWYCWLSFPFPFPPPEFHREVPLLCSTYKFVYDHVCFCVCLSFGSYKLENIHLLKNMQIKF
jgi:hypothetical protein